METKTFYRQPLSAQVKKGLARAFQKFTEYDLAKYNRDGAVKLRDVLFLSHAKPQDKQQASLWKRLVDNKLETPDTWEVALSATKGEDKRAEWERLLKERKLGALALLRNLRNMHEAGVKEKLIFEALADMKIERVLPFRFITAAKYAPQWENKIEPIMFKAIEGHEKMAGKTVLLIDNSGSMRHGRVSAKSELSYFDAAGALAILLREICEDVTIMSFSDTCQIVPARRGFALPEAISKATVVGGTYLGKAVYDANKIKADRLIVLTDEQSADAVPNPKAKNAYMINVAASKNGVGYGAWTHIDGFSEAIVDYIKAYEAMK